MTTPSPAIRVRRRIPPITPLPTGPLRSTHQPIAEHTRVISEGSTIRGLRVAFEETPIKLRELEAGWREGRRVGLRDKRGDGDRLEVGQSAVRNMKDGLNKKDNSRIVIAEAGGRGLAAKGHNQASSSTMPKPDKSGTQRSRPPRSSPIAPIPIAFTVPTRPRTVTLRQIPSRSPTYAPPSPPPTPPPVSTALAALHKTPAAPPRRYDLTHHPVRQQPGPLLSSPLVPTPHPVPLTSRSTDTIHIHPAPGGITLSLCAQAQTIQISHDGRIATISTHTPFGNIEAGIRSRQLSLDNLGKWSEGDKRYWESVRKLIEGYKRLTPKVKLYLPLGNLTITCSTPPDVLLNFTHTSDVPDDEAPIPAAAARSTTKVRVRLSLSENQVVIDTASTFTGGTERLRTKRTTGLFLPSLPSCSSDKDPMHSADDIVLALQATLRSADGWTKAEKAGLDRMCELREEWGRFV